MANSKIKNGVAVVAAMSMAVAALGFSVDSLYTCNAVLQRGVEIPVSGKGVPGASVEVSFAGHGASAKVGADGRWCVKLPPMGECAQGRELVVESGGERCVATNVLVGEVFLCSGQSNMQQPLWCGGWGGGFSDRKGVLESRIARWPLFRYARSNSGAWDIVADRAIAGRTSAISYYFATTLLRAEPGVPVGVVNLSRGGSRIEPWIPGEKGTFFNSLVAPLAPFRFRAAIWYQGESNVRDGDLYTAKLHALADGWRKALEAPSLPFIVSEIAPYDTSRGFPAFWRAQQRFADEDGNAVCVPINDCGDVGTVHPDRKELPAMRFAAIVLNKFYGRTDVPCEIPRAVGAEADAGGAVVRFEGVKTLGVNSYPKYTNHNIAGFELCGEDGQWHKAKAWISGSRIRVFTPAVPSPRRVRYLGGDEMEGEVYSADSNFVPSAFEFEVAESSIDAEMQRKCQEVCDWAVREGLQGALQFCAYRDGKCIVDVWAGSMTTNDGAAKVDGATLFPIFSTEKPFLATAVHRAVEKGRMAYDKPISTWWPEFSGDGKEKLTLGHVLGYRSGVGPSFPKGIEDVPGQCDWKRICALAAKEKLVAEPGTVQKYMALSYGWMLGHPLEIAMRKSIVNVLSEEVLLPCGIEDEFFFAATGDAIRRTATVYKSKFFETMNDDRLRRMCLPSAYAVANARSLARFYNRLCGYDGEKPLVSPRTLAAALKPSRHASDPLPPPEVLDRDWHMIFGMGYGLWGPSSDISRIFGHGGVGGSEGLCDTSKRLTVGFTCNFGKDVRKVRSKLYGIVGMKWRYWNDAEADIQNLQMRSMGK